MRRHPRWSFLAISLNFSFSFAQLLNGLQVFVENPEISKGCLQALHTNVSCPIFLSVVSQSGAILDSEHVNALCTSSCEASLESVAKTIKKACTAKTDVMTIDGTTYPATFIIDNFQLTHDTSCKKDRKTGQYCDVQSQKLSNQKNHSSDDYLCSDCYLGAQVIELSSPLGYDQGLADNFAALTSSCKVKSYSYTSPGSYALATPPSATTTSPSASTASTAGSQCRKTYVVRDYDDCNAVAKAHSVSTYDLLTANNMDLSCSSFSAAAGSKICIPDQCKTHTWQALDTCDGLAQQMKNFTSVQFRSWNPMFNQLCYNSLGFVGWEVCVSPPGDYVDASFKKYESGDNHNTKSPSGTQTDIPTAVPAPKNAMKASTHSCGEWYTIAKGDTCQKVSDSKGVPINQLHSLNPELDKECTNLALGMAYCIKPGKIATATSSMPTAKSNTPKATSNTPEATSNMPSQPIITKVVTEIPTDEPVVWKTVGVTVKATVSTTVGCSGIPGDACENSHATMAAVRMYK